jgi:signal transduction histidine kinase
VPPPEVAPVPAQSTATLLGAVNLAALLGLVPLMAWPTDWAAFLTLGVGTLLLERGAVTLDGEFRFTPAAPFYLAAGMLPTVGAAALGLLLIVETATRRWSNFLAGMEAQLPIGSALAVMGLAAKLAPAGWWLPALFGPTVFCLVTLWLEKGSRWRLSAKERIYWLRARMQIRPLQLTLALSSLAVAALTHQGAGLELILVPLLASCAIAAENVVLKARTASTDQVLHALADARGQQREAVKKLAEAQTEKQLMEGFSAHLARSPGLQATSQALVATVHQLVKADDAVVFLSPNPEAREVPEPFYYRVAEEHQDRLQGLALTALREELVDACWQHQAPQTAKDLAPSPGRLFKSNAVAAALPLSRLGVLYIGRQEHEPFSKAELQRLSWLAEKARLAFESAFRDHEREQRQAMTQQKLQELQQRVALLGTLIRSAEEMAATLQLEELADRLSGLLRETIRHSEGMLVFSWDTGKGDFATTSAIKRAWGGAGAPRDLTLPAAVQKSGQPLLVKDLAHSPFSPPSPGMASIIASPLLAHDKICGVVVLGAPVKDAFGQDQLDQLRLIAYQAGMAFSNARLFQQVVVARQQLEESQESLIQSSKMSAIGKLAAGVAHELNTPLGVMHLALEQATDQLAERPQAAQRMIDKAMKAIERSRSITERLLAYSRKPSGEHAPVRLDQVVQETVSFLSFELRKAQAETRLRLGPATVMGSAQELQQVLVNLVLNALYAMQDNPLERRVVGISILEEAQEALLEVSDMGVGMTAEQREQAFEPFYTTKPVGKGTGLGLWVSLQIMEQHKGTLEIESTPGQGSTFRIRLPKSPSL